jgi:hypothetical protein
MKNARIRARGLLVRSCNAGQNALVHRCIVFERQLGISRRKSLGTRHAVEALHERNVTRRVAGW